MADPRDITKEGLLSTIKAILFLPSAGGTVGAWGKVKNMRFVNSVAGAYHIDIYHRISDSSGDVLIYSIDLDDGDFVVDDTEFFIGVGGAILGKSNIATVNYFINAVQFPNPTDI